MTSPISEYSTRQLLEIIRQRPQPDDTLDQQARLQIFQRWRDGHDTEPLLELMQAQAVDDRVQGAYFLVEVVPRHQKVVNAAIKLADDPVSYCRKTFAGYATNTGVYGETIAIGLAKCIEDSNPYVRLETINWAVYTTRTDLATFRIW